MKGCVKTMAETAHRSTLHSSECLLPQPCLLCSESTHYSAKPEVRKKKEPLNHSIQKLYPSLAHSELAVDY